MAQFPVSPGRRATATLLLILAVTGCENESHQHRQWVRESIARQEEQNRQTAETARRLVEADAEARQELVGLQRDLQAEHKEIGDQRDALEAERRQIAEQRHRDPIIAAAIQSAVWLFLCALPLVLCWYLLRGQPADDEAGALEEILILEMARETATPGSSLLLPGPGTDGPQRLAPPATDEQENPSPEAA